MPYEPTPRFAISTEGASSPSSAHQLSRAPTSMPSTNESPVATMRRTPRVFFFASGSPPAPSAAPPQTKRARAPCPVLALIADARERLLLRRREDRRIVGGDAPSEEVAVAQERE